MKATIRIELVDEVKGTSADQLSVEAPTLDMLKDTVTRTVLLQMTDLLRHVFENPEFVKPKAKEPKNEPKPKPAAAKKAADNAGG